MTLTFFRSGIVNLNAIALLLLPPSFMQANQEILDRWLQNTHPYNIVQDENKVFWFENPDGERFISLGINAIHEKDIRIPEGEHSYNALAKHDGNVEAWGEELIELLQSFELNTMGAWSTPIVDSGPLYRTPVLYLGRWRANRGLNGFYPTFEEEAREKMAEVLAQYPDPSLVIGFFLDNEIPWGGRRYIGISQSYTILEQAISFEEGNPAREGALQFLQNRYGTVEEFCRKWQVEISDWNELTDVILQSGLNTETLAARDAFNEYAATLYYETATRVVREMAPGKLILGDRYAGGAPHGVLRAAGRYNDVISFNTYPFGGEPSRNALETNWALGGRPLLIGEFGWRSRENFSDNPNTRGTGEVVDTQRQRAARYLEFAPKLYEYPWVVGAHWFQYVDQPAIGRRNDGENSNYGIIARDGRIYEEVRSVMSYLNPKLPEIHANAWRNYTERVAPPRIPFRNPVFQADKPEVLNLFDSDMILPPETAQGGDGEASLDHDGENFIFRYNTHEGWAVASFLGPEKFAIENAPEHATDWSGYETLVIEATLPEIVIFSVHMDEAGISRPWQGSEAYDTRGGDHGESYSSQTHFGRGERHEYRLPFRYFFQRGEFNNYHGNQSGNKQLDLHSMKNLTLFVPGQQGEGEFIIHSIRFE